MFKGYLAAVNIVGVDTKERLAAREKEEEKNE